MNVWITYCFSFFLWNCYRLRKLDTISQKFLHSARLNLNQIHHDFKTCTKWDGLVIPKDNFPSDMKLNFHFSDVRTVERYPQGAISSSSWRSKKLFPNGRKTLTALTGTQLHRHRIWINPIMEKRNKVWWFLEILQGQGT